MSNLSFLHLYRQDASNFKAPGLKLLVNKKNIHRLIKVRAEKASDNIKGSVSRTVGSQSGDDIDSEELERETQKERDDKITAEVLYQCRKFIITTNSERNCIAFLIKFSISRN